MFLKIMKLLNTSLLCGGLLFALGLSAQADSGREYGIQEAWDNPTTNMASGSIKPGYAQLSWSKGSVLPVKLRNGMITMISLPNGEQIVEAVEGNPGLFDYKANEGDRTI